jgi:hypothetical protein
LTYSEDLRVFLCEHQVVDAIAKAITHFQGIESVSAWGCFALAQLSDNYGRDILPCDIPSLTENCVKIESVLNTVFQVIRTFPHVAEICGHASTILVNIVLAHVVSDGGLGP